MFKTLIVLCFFSLAMASEFVSVQSNYRAQDGDAISFVKKELLYRSYKEVITKELKRLKFDANQFWTLYNEEFEKSFAKKKEALKEKYQVEEGDISSEKYKKYVEQVTKSRVYALQGFGNIGRVIQSYSIKKMSRSTSNPNLRYMTLEAKVNDQALTKLYFEFTKTSQELEAGSLYVDVRYNFNTLTDQDLGVSSRDEFTSTINRKWVEWFNKNPPANIDDIDLVTESEKARFDSLFMQNGAGAFSQTDNSYHLLIKVNLEKKGDHRLSKESRFTISGTLVLRSLRDLSIVYQDNLPITHKTFLIDENVSLSSLVATAIYQVPKTLFQQSKDLMKGSMATTQYNEIKLAGFKTSTQVFEFIELLKSKGVRHSMKPELISFDPSNYLAGVYYRGDKTDLLSVLNSLQPAKTDTTYEVFEADGALSVKLKNVSSGVQRENF